MTNDNLKTSYDEIPYIAKTYKSALPQTQKAVISLFSFQTPSLKNARILEIGCSFGANLFSYAMAYPESHCVGIDLSEVQINEGLRIRDQLGLKNVHLYAQDILEYNGELGEFDFIICHGVFSWVPPAVQDAILKTIKTSLAKNGTALISYNTYPGWKDTDIQKDIMKFRIANLKAHQSEVNEDNIVQLANGALEFLAQYAFTKREFYQQQWERLQEKERHYIRHEFLEYFNQPMYLIEFQNKLNQHGLSHVVDAEISRSIPILPEEIQNKLNAECAIHIYKEQYYDYLLNRQFRSSIITHEENIANINVSGNIAISALEGLFIRKKLYERDVDQDLVQALDKHYPHFIQIKELEKELPNYDKNQFYSLIWQNIFTGKVDLLVENIKTREAFDVNKDKPKMKPIYQKYFNYIAETETPVIKCGNHLGYLFPYTNAEAIVTRFFNGENSFEEIEKLIFKAAKEDRILNINKNTDDVSEEQIIRDFVTRLTSLLLADNCFE